MSTDASAGERPILLDENPSGALSKVMAPPSDTAGECNQLVSVVIPARDRARTIERAVVSVLTQTYAPVEVIVVDDGSRDATSEIVARCESADPRVRLIRHPESRGAQAARNTGIRASRGYWVAFLDSDDWLYPHSVAVRVAEGLGRNVRVVHSAGTWIQHDGETPKPYHVPAIAGDVYDVVLRNEGPLFPALLVTREALEAIGHLDESIVAFQEWDTSIRLAQRFPFGFVEQPTFVYDCVGTDTISKNLRRNGVGYEQVVAKHRTAILRRVGPAALAEHYRLAANWYSAAGDESARRRCHRRERLWTVLDGRWLIRRIKGAVRRILRVGR